MLKANHFELSARVNYLMTRFLEKNRGRLSRLVKGEELKQVEVIEDEKAQTRYDVLLVYRQGGWFSDSSLNCFINGEHVARALL